MSVRIVRLGTPRQPGEGLRIGTVRRPPRGVPRAEIATRDYYDVWFPLLAPAPETVRLGRAARTAAERARFARRYRAEMKRPDAAHALDLLVALSRRTALSAGCYCAEPAGCHRTLLAALLAERGADVVPEVDGAGEVEAGRAER